VKYLLAPRNVRRLLELPEGRPLLAFDFDGTLAPIVENREAARMRRQTARLFHRVCMAFPCAVISGRSRPDVARRLGPAPVRYVVGDHGADAGDGGRRFDAQMADVLRRLRRALGGEPGIDFEDKRSSLAIHYREAPRRGDARAAIDRALAPLSRRVRVVPGKCVVNVLPRRAPHKGDAIRRLIRAARADVALYVGDDDTDEDVFGLPAAVRLVTVRVGASRRSAAEFYLREQREIDRLLRHLADARHRPSGGQRQARARRSDRASPSDRAAATRDA
jgi:trehalose 6-phosphate phosphatase